MNTLKKSIFSFPNQTSVYHGKVRDVYTLKNNTLVMVASDRISAFDHVLPKGIPFKGQVLNQIASYFLKETASLVPNWLISTPDPVVSIGKACEPIKIEMVIRGYLAGHAAREYKLGKRMLCGVKMPDGLKENDAFPEPIITPASKADEGHDEDISKEEILSNKLVTEEVYLKMEEYTKLLFSHGSAKAKEKGLILVDTKYEFGLYNGEVMLIDEIHTPDSSRYFYLEGYKDRQKENIAQKQLSKEFVREWLMDNGFQGKENQKMPEMPEEFVSLVSNRYIELYEKITGETFVREVSSNIPRRIEDNVINFLKNA
ncbi:MAG: phosphoribosylaminoimidazolesuccinocarboxamide synthase [Crocinitomicaceae bacterium]|nr:phosphoribosylaminoimidazolesuccinocarboxamide synthase [Crocinitomicaceae bacterium]